MVCQEYILPKWLHFRENLFDYLKIAKASTIVYYSFQFVQLVMCTKLEKMAIYILHVFELTNVKKNYTSVDVTLLFDLWLQNTKVLQLIIGLSNRQKAFSHPLVAQNVKFDYNELLILHS